MDEQTADDLNLLACFLARRGVPSPETPQADVVVVLGNSILASVEVAVQACQAVPGSRLVCSGGVGHSTEDLRDSLRRTSRYADVLTEGRTEASMMSDVAIRCSLHPNRILIEDRSTNTGENVALTRRLLDTRGFAPRALLIVQDPTMQLRAHATFQKEWGDRSEVRLVSYAPFVPHVDEHLCLTNEVSGLWPFERFVSLVLGEIPRLRSYGPQGKGFIARVELPDPVLQAFERLSRRFPQRS